MRGPLRGLSILALAVATVLAQLPHAFLDPSTRWATASFTGANGRIYFQSDRTGDFDVYAVNPDGTGVTNLTASPGVDDQPAVSPGGLGVAFVSDRTGSTEVWTMNYDGSRPRQLTRFGPHSALVGYPSWLPDLHVVFVSDVKGSTELYSASPRGDDVVQLTNDGELKLRPVASSTTFKVAYASRRGGQWDLYVRDLTTGVETRLTNDIFIEDNPSWTPDGLTILYDVNDPSVGDREIFSVPATGGAPTSLSTGAAGVSDVHPVMSPGGDFIVFESNRGTSGGVPWSLWRMSAAGGDPTRLTSGTGNDRSPDWAMRVLVVNSASDPGPPTCDPDVCTLRAALNAANSSPGRDGIAFRIPGSGVQTIALAANLPAVAQPVIIDGTTQPGYVSAPVVFLDGSTVPATPLPVGLRVDAGDSVIAALAIGHFRGDAIQLYSKRNLVVGNYLGVEPSGAAAGNLRMGVYVTSFSPLEPAGNVIRGNVVSANGYGVFIESSSNVIEANLIGTNAAGTAALGSQLNGVTLQVQARDNRIGGPAASRGNTISGNTHGIFMAEGADANVVMSNHVGTTVSGDEQLPNADGGIVIAGGNDNVIGPTGFPNVIAGNRSYGLLIRPHVIGEALVGGSGNVVGHNYIGANPAGMPLGNEGPGLLIVNASGNAVGPENTITGNIGSGIEISGAVASSNRISATRIYMNGGLGIELGPRDGPTANDSGDVDDGPNQLQNFPQILSAVPGEATTTFDITLASRPDTDHTIQLYWSPACDPSGYGEGQTWVGSVGGRTDGSGNLRLTPTLAGAVPAGAVVTATATDSSGNTSEFSACATVGGPVSISAQVVNDVDHDGVIDASDTSLAAAKLELFRLDAAGNRMTPAVATAVNSPTISVTGIEAGSFELVESDPTGHGSTAAIPGANATMVDANTLRITLLPGQSSSGNAFLDATTPTGVAIDPTSYDFGQRPVGTSTQAPIAIVNNSLTQTLIVDRIIVTSGDWAASGCTTVSPGQVCFVIVQFTPQSGGPKSGRVDIQTNAGPLLGITLRGVGTGEATGVAQYVETTGTGPATTTILGNTLVTLSSGGVEVGSTDAGPDGRYRFLGLAASSEYRVTYNGHIGPEVGGRDVQAQVTFTTDQYANASVPAPPALLNRMNHTWLRPFELQPNTPIPDFIRRANESTWYVLRGVNAGDRVTVRLTNSPVDNSLIAFRNVRLVAQQLLAAAGAIAPQQLLQQQLAGDVSAEDMDSDDMDSEDMDSEDMDSEDMDSEDMDSEDMDSDDMDSEDMDSDDMDSEDMDSDGQIDVVQYGDVYGTAQRRALLSGSVTPGTADETIVLTNRSYSGDLYFRVRGHAGVFDASRAFTITVTVDPSPYCAGAPLTTRWVAPSVTATSTIILTHTGRMSFADAAERTAFDTALVQLATRTTAVIVDLARTEYDMGAVYAAWDSFPLCVPQANAVVDSIRGLIKDVVRANPGLEYVVIAGPDSAIPFARRVDTAEISRESRWDVPYLQGTPQAAAQSQGFLLTDDAYASDIVIERLGNPIYIPTRAVGRLVETPADMLAYLDWYFADGTIELTNALVTGYDFVTDLATRLAQTLAGAGAAVDTLISDTWSSDDLRTKLLGTTQAVQPLPAPETRYDLIAAQGHYSANRLQPADLGARFLPQDLDLVTDGRFRGSLWATIGCHSAHNIVNGAADINAQPLAFAETLLRQGATVVGGTGYQYGESVLTTNSEALYVALARELALRQDLALRPYNGDVPIGKALANAKRLYLGRLLTVRGIDEKVVSVATLYGLPMVTVAATTRHDRTAAGHTFSGVQPLMSATHDFNGLDLRRGDDGAGGQYWYVTTTENVVTPAFRPVLPATFAGMTAVDAAGAPFASAVATGAIWLTGAYRLEAHIPLVSRPVTEQSAPNPLYANEGFGPSRPFILNQLDPGRQTLIFAPMQYDSALEQARLWTDSRFKIYWSSQGAEAALRDPPLLYTPTLTRTPDGKIAVSIRVRHFESATETVEAYATYMAPGTATTGTLASEQLAGGTSHADGEGFVREFTGTITPPNNGAATIRVFFQAVGGNGKVATRTNDGLLYALAPTTPTVAQPKTSTHLALAIPSGSITYRAQVDVTATLTDGSGAALGGRAIVFRLGGARQRALTNDQGVAQAQLLALATPGPAQVTASFAETATELASDAAYAVSVGRGPTSIEPVAGTLEYSDARTVATLRLTGRGVTLGEQNVTLTIAGRGTLATVTGPNGELTLDTNDFAGLRPGTYDVALAYAGNAYYAGTGPTTVQVEVAPEQADVTVDAPAPMPTQAVTLTGTLAQQSDGSAGALANAKVHVTLRGTTGPTVEGDAAVGSDGRWTITLTAGADVYAVEATAAGFYTSVAATTLVPVYDTDHFVNGGGTIAVPPSSRATLAFTIRYRDGTTTPEGSVILQVRPEGIDLRATSFSWLAVSGTTAQFEGTGTVNGVSGYTFYATATEGSPDTFTIRVWDADSSYGSPDVLISGDVTGSVRTR